LPALKKIKSPEIENIWGGHAGVSQATLKFLKTGKHTPTIAGSHHGFTPNLSGRIASDEPFGGKAWQTQREKLVLELKSYFNCDWPNISTPEQARVLAGLTTVSDWIGSGPYFEDPALAWAPNIERALDNAGFVRPSLRPNL
jgi:CRISPR-associated endonuclease/helicase Cas3